MRDALSLPALSTNYLIGLMGVLGQLICSVLLDHYGWLRFDVHSLSGVRLPIPKISDNTRQL